MWVGWDWRRRKKGSFDDGKGPAKTHPRKPLGSRLPQNCHPLSMWSGVGGETWGFDSIGCSSGNRIRLVVASIVRRKKKKKGVPCDNATTIDHDRFRNKAILIFLSALSAFLTKQIWWRIRGSLPSVGWMIHGYSTVLMNEIK